MPPVLQVVSKNSILSGLNLINKRRNELFYNALSVYFKRLLFAFKK